MLKRLEWRSEMTAFSLIIKHSLVTKISNDTIGVYNARTPYQGT